MRFAIDTNILVRIFVDDNTEQRVAVDRLAREHQIVIAPTVLLETEWVLRGGLGLDRDRIVAGFERLLGLRNATFLQRDMVEVAMAAFRSGCDFADALHAASVPAVDAFLTFDRAFVRLASALGDLPPVRRLEIGAS
jgi:predicted nucleic-acid-binding protein